MLPIPDAPLLGTINESLEQQNWSSNKEKIDLGLICPNWLNRVPKPTKVIFL
jgi:hypothetical protein